MKNLVENEFGTGAIKSPKDKRDYKWSNIAMAIEPFDWSKGYDIEQERGKLKVKNQNGSGSCGGQAWSYYAFALDLNDNEEKSAAFIYHNTRVEPAGSAGRTNCQFCINTGVANESLCSSYDNGNPPSEAYMKNLVISQAAYDNAKTNKELKYARVNLNIEDVAQAIRENKGCVLGIYGTNNGTWRSMFVMPPLKIDTSCWAHWIYCGKVRMLNGEKYIGFLNSWGEDTGDKGWQWFSEEYFKKGGFFEGWTMTTLPVEKFLFTKTMKLGSKNSEVKELQKRLGVIQTSFFGTLTLKAVKKFQLDHGLKDDGIVGPLTRAELNK